MKIVLHGTLKDQFKELEIVAATAADALDGWSRQCGLTEIPVMDRPIIEVVDFDTEIKLNTPTDVQELHLFPMMFGGGGAFGKILLGAALIGLSFIPGLGQAIQVALLGAGIGMALGGVMEFFMKAPSVSKSNDPDPSKYLGLGNNTTAIGTLIPKGYGRFLLAGQYLSLQVNSNDMVYGTFPTTVPA